ncbi:MAG: hypothetical protein M3313_16145 [Actinomycetota bacterium]|nr:hypothetical protein [Actinomycetota bacterium]
MTNRRDTFILVPSPGKGEEEAQADVSTWLRDIEGTAGYRGGAVLKESANELLPNTLVLTLDFQSTDAIRAFRKEIGEGTNPITNDDKATKSADQVAVLGDLEGAPALRYEKGNGMLALPPHVHGLVVDEHTVSPN